MANRSVSITRVTRSGSVAFMPIVHNIEPESGEEDEEPSRQADSSSARMSTFFGRNLRSRTLSSPEPAEILSSRHRHDKLEVQVRWKDPKVHPTWVFEDQLADRGLVTSFLKRQNVQPIEDSTRMPAGDGKRAYQSTLVAETSVVTLEEDEDPWVEEHPQPLQKPTRSDVSQSFREEKGLGRRSQPEKEALQSKLAKFKLFSEKKKRKKLGRASDDSILISDDDEEDLCDFASVSSDEENNLNELTSRVKEARSVGRTSDIFPSTKRKSRLLLKLPQSTLPLAGHSSSNASITVIHDQDVRSSETQIQDISSDDSFEATETILPAEMQNTLPANGNLLDLVNVVEEFRAPSEEIPLQPSRLHDSAPPRIRTMDPNSHPAGIFSQKHRAVSLWKVLDGLPGSHYMVQYEGEECCRLLARKALLSWSPEVEIFLDELDKQQNLPVTPPADVGLRPVSSNSIL